MQAFHSDHFTLPLPPGHRFPMSKYRLLREAVERDLPGIRVHEAPAGQRRRTGAGAFAGVCQRGGRRAAVARAAARDRLSMVAAHGRARAPLGRRDDCRGARCAGRGPGGQPGRRHPPCVPGPRLGLLRLQRRGGGRAADAGRMAPPAPSAAARAGHRPGRAPGQRHRGDLPRRPDGVHAVAARRAQLPGAQGGQRPGRGTA